MFEVTQEGQDKRGKYPAHDALGSMTVASVTSRINQIYELKQGLPGLTPQLICRRMLQGCPQM